MVPPTSRNCHAAIADEHGPRQGVQNEMASGQTEFIKARGPLSRVGETPGPRCPGLAAAAGETVLATSAASALLGRLQGRGQAPALSAQEVKVLRLAADGLTNAAIGAELYIGEATVKTYLARAYEKLGVSDRTSAVRRALELGLID